MELRFSSCESISYHCLSHCLNNKFYSVQCQYLLLCLAFWWLWDFIVRHRLFFFLPFMSFGYLNVFHPKQWLWTSIRSWVDLLKRLANIAVARVSWTMFDGSCEALFWTASFSNLVLLQSWYHRLLRAFLDCFWFCFCYCCFIVVTFSGMLSITIINRLLHC